MIEIEQKFRVADAESLQQKILNAGAVPGATQRHRDTYYSHPCREFAETREALRIRRITGEDAGAPTGDAVTAVTYKGRHQSEQIKARRELEWRLDPCDPDGANLAELLELLGFAPVLTVEKRRRLFELQQDGGLLSLTIDEADSLGTFAEIETIAGSADEIETHRQRIERLAGELGLREKEARSYLQMSLDALKQTGQVR